MSIWKTFFFFFKRWMHLSGTLQWVWSFFNKDSESHLQKILRGFKDLFFLLSTLCLRLAASRFSPPDSRPINISLRSILLFRSPDGGCAAASLYILCIYDDDDSFHDSNDFTLKIISVKRQLSRNSPPPSCVLGQVILSLWHNSYLQRAVCMLIYIWLC